LSWRKRQFKRWSRDVSPGALAAAAARFSATARQYMAACARIGHGTPQVERELAEHLDDLWRKMGESELMRVEAVMKRRGDVLKMGLALVANKTTSGNRALERALEAAREVWRRRFIRLMVRRGRSEDVPGYRP